MRGGGTEDGKEDFHGGGTKEKFANSWQYS